ncbi:MAG: Gfo/Idh/MocA family oxidoreductase [Verrucomicrobia subdivision 3 bacterium]|nr:Gfo/Idh/MocA family oxidoreductase [Limisphaerales bacterium]
MKTKRKKRQEAEFNRRDFLKGGSLATMMAMLGGVELRAQVPEAKPEEQEPGALVKCGVIGLGARGREIVSTLTRLKEAEISAVCDKYPPFLKRGGNLAPKAKAVGDYRPILDDKEIKAVVIATPTHQHKEIVKDAFQAGKHVYCEAPLAHTIEDARAIAQAARAANRQVFQAGLQMRSDPQRHFLLPFIRAGALGNIAMARAQWHKKQSWRAAAPTPEREREMNWRLRNSSSTGIMGEIGIHQLDMCGLFLNTRPVSVTGFGSLIHWNDGRDVPDTVQTIVEYPGGVRLIYHATLVNSFDSDYEMYYGSDAAVMLRENKAWMFKEVDSPLLGWEVYARKDTFYKETGIALVANATKLAAQGEKPVEEAPFTNTPLYYALEAFITNVNEISTAVEDFSASFNINDKPALEKYLADIRLQPHATWMDGYGATVVAIKANEAVVKGQKITFQKEWFELG